MNITDAYLRLYRKRTTQEATFSQRHWVTMLISERINVRLEMGLDNHKSPVSYFGKRQGYLEYAAYDLFFLQNR